MSYPPPGYPQGQPMMPGAQAYPGQPMMPGQPGMMQQGMPGQGYPGQPGMMQGGQPYPGQPGMMPGQGYPGQQGMMQPGMMPGQGYPGQPGMMPGQGYPGQPGMMPGQGYPGQPGGMMPPRPMLPPGASVWVPGQPYTLPQLQWQSPYNPRVPIGVPVGLDPSLHHKVDKASMAFRHYDKDYSGYLSKHEFKKAVHHLSHGWDDGHVDGLFHHLDNYTGRVGEREFVTWYITTHTY